MKAILREYYELCSDGYCDNILTEGERKRIAEGAMILVGKLQEAECLNGNGRVYSHPILQREIRNYQKAVKEGRALGELDHPPEAVINLRNVSHKVTEIWMDGKKVMGKIEVLPTPAGQTLRSLIDSGCKVGISSRGLGSVMESNGKTVVQDDFQLICFDVVSEPSTPGAWMDYSPLNEGVDRTKIFTKADRINRALNDILE